MLRKVARRIFDDATSRFWAVGSLGFSGQPRGGWGMDAGDRRGPDGGGVGFTLPSWPGLSRPSAPERAGGYAAFDFSIISTKRRKR
jgi:hypothetical protein